ncbi:hypothetical protein TCON_1117 [Astathelohania contejeani]|uniref:Uncharacterized protein n=1 Tax=Astathelohania contejeani TaxID=164912 RepID=A0ABQ7HZW3_9MICR|nr:hypothetical protein TCON_1117 [Thelohania contejeani]
MIIFSVVRSGQKTFEDGEENKIMVELAPADKKTMKLSPICTDVASEAFRNKLLPWLNISIFKSTAPAANDPLPETVRATTASAFHNAAINASMSEGSLVHPFMMGSIAKTIGADPGILCKEETSEKQKSNPETSDKPETKEEAKPESSSEDESDEEKKNKEGSTALKVTKSVKI